MLQLRITRDAEKALDKMIDKHFCQLYDAVVALRSNPKPIDSKEIISNILPRRRRKDVGEYRIIYWDDENILYIDVIGKRNDQDVYKKAKRKGIL